MIKFFRHIRKSLLMENKTGKYFKYAIGEIILVVIGILIAVSINNWNSQRINKNRNQALLQKLSQELDLNISRASELETESFTQRLIYADSVFRLLNKNKITDHLDYALEDNIFYVHHFNLNTSVFEELKNTSSLYAIGSDSLVTEIQRYYQLCDRESFYNLEYSKTVTTLNDKCYDGWYDFVHLYEKNPEDALKRHSWITNPQSKEFIEFRQFIDGVIKHSYLMSRKLKGIIDESKKLKQLISLELGVL